VLADLPQMTAILQRFAADVDELVGARRVADLGAAAALPDRGRTAAPGSRAGPELHNTVLRLAPGGCSRSLKVNMAATFKMSM
jgi:hypothetical protein